MKQLEVMSVYILLRGKSEQSRESRGNRGNRKQGGTLKPQLFEITEELFQKRVIHRSILNSLHC